MQKSLIKSKERVNKFGEVFTPVELVQKMIDRLPIEYYSDPTKTYSFMIIEYQT